jgi:hypothetical protein
VYLERSASSGFCAKSRCGRRLPLSALNLEILSRSFALVWDFVALDNLPFIQTAEASLLDCGNVDETALSAATLWLNESIPFL